MNADGIRALVDEVWRQYVGGEESALHMRVRLGRPDDLQDLLARLERERTELRARLEALLAQPWIKVSERLPTDNQRVWAWVVPPDRGYDDPPSAYVAEYHAPGIYANGTWSDVETLASEFGPDYLDVVTHWMPFMEPAAPAEGD